MNNEKKQRKTIEWERLESSSRKLETARKHFMKGWAIKDRNGKDLTEAEEFKKRWQEYTELYQKNYTNDLSSVQFSRSVVSDSLQPHKSQHARPPCPSPTPGVQSNSCPSSQ